MGVAAIPLVIAAIGAAVSTKAAIDQGKSQSDLANFRAKVAENNRIIAEASARDIEKQGEVNAAREALRTSQAIGQARARAAGRGVVVDQGSSLDIQEDLAVGGAANILTIRDNTARQALARRQQVQGFATEAGLLSITADNAIQASRIRAGSTLLDSAGVVANRWYDNRRLDELTRVQ